MFTASQFSLSIIRQHETLNKFQNEKIEAAAQNTGFILGFAFFQKKEQNILNSAQKLVSIKDEINNDKSRAHLAVHTISGRNDH